MRPFATPTTPTASTTSTATLLLALLIALPLLGGCTTAGEPASRPADTGLQVRPVVDNPADGEAMVDPSNPGQRLYVGPEVLLDESALAAVGPVTSDDGQAGILIALTDAGAERMREITTAHAGQRLALILDDQVLIAPTIQSPVSQQIVLGFSDATQAERQRVLDRLRALIPSSPTTQPAR